jgi:small subunit ribosomal protein S20
MPIIKSAIKQLRQNSKRQLRNRVQKNRLKELLKQFVTFVQEGKTKEATENLPKAYQAIDKAVKKQLVHPNTGARKKSQLAKMVAGLAAKK